MLIILCIVIICCTVSVNNNIEKSEHDIMDYLILNMPNISDMSKIYSSIEDIKYNVIWIEANLELIENDI